MSQSLGSTVGELPSLGSGGGLASVELKVVTFVDRSLNFYMRKLAAARTGPIRPDLQRRSDASVR